VVREERRNEAEGKIPALHGSSRARQVFVARTAVYERTREEDVETRDGNKKRLEEFIASEEVCLASDEVFLVSDEVFVVSEEVFVASPEP
jgi:hypothetical protein